MSTLSIRSDHVFAISLRVCPTLQGVTLSFSGVAGGLWICYIISSWNTLSKILCCFLYHSFDIHVSTPFFWYPCVYTIPVIFMYQHHFYNIYVSTSFLWYRCIYTIPVIFMYLHHSFDIHISRPFLWYYFINTVYSFDIHVSRPFLWYSCIHTIP